jgi:hypothetical protein
VSGVPRPIPATHVSPETPRRDRERAIALGVRQRLAARARGAPERLDIAIETEYEVSVVEFLLGPRAWASISSKSTHIDTQPIDSTCVLMQPECGGSGTFAEMRTVSPAFGRPRSWFAE